MTEFVHYITTLGLDELAMLHLFIDCCYRRNSNPVAEYEQIRLKSDENN
jgi:hypothetical protein